jgi:hypothetical protein
MELYSSSGKKLSKGFNIITLQFTLFLILSVSCATPLYFEKTVPPEISVDIKPCTIAFVNIFNYTQPEAVKVENQNVYRNAINKFGMELGKIGSTDSSYRFFVADTLFRGVSASNQTVMLSPDTIQLLTSIYRSDYLLTLDSVSLFLQEDESDTDNEGYQVIFNNFYLVGDYFLSLYSLSGDLVNRSEVTMSSRYGNKPVLSNILGLPSFSRAAGLAGEIGIAAADNYADRFYPVVSQEQRYVYTGSQFRESNKLIVKEQFDKASEILNRLSKSPRSSLAQKAEHNLAVLKEVKESVKLTPEKLD